MPRPPGGGGRAIEMSLTPDISASAVRHQLMLLTEERVLALESGRGRDREYLDDLAHEIEACRAAYVGAAVTEIALLRAQLDGANQG